MIFIATRPHPFDASPQPQQFWDIPAITSNNRHCLHFQCVFFGSICPPCPSAHSFSFFICSSSSAPPSRSVKGPPTSNKRGTSETQRGEYFQITISRRDPISAHIGHSQGLSSHSVSDFSRNPCTRRLMTILSLDNGLGRRRNGRTFVAAQWDCH